jgi:hypothetical protein
MLEITQTVHRYFAGQNPAGRLLALLLLALFGCVAPSAAAADNPHAETLSANGVTTDVAGVRRYLLHELHPDTAQREKIEKLIVGLGDPSFAVREKSMSELLSMPYVPSSMLVGASKKGDPEVRWRAQKVFKVVEPKNAHVLYAVLGTIVEEKIVGAADAVLGALGDCTSAYLKDMAKRALVTTSRVEDVPLLRDSVGGKDPFTRKAATAALGKSLGTRCTSDMLPLLADADERVALEAALALGNIGDHRSLAALGRLLDAKLLDVRSASAGALQGLTGQTFVFTAYEEKLDVRRGQAKAWLDWIAEQGPEVKLQFPLKSTQLVLGRTLVCFYAENIVIELDSKGKQTHQFSGLKYPWCAIGLPNGHRLIAWYGSQCVVEYDAAGKEVWKQQGLPRGPMSVERLPNGNTLIACHGAHQVIEVNRAGKTVWQAAITGGPGDARRLPNGNTLVTLLTGGKIVELDRAGKVVWELTGLKGPRSAQRLPNGNTLVAEFGRKRVVEFDRGKKEVWSRDGFVNVFEAQRLSNGNTLVADNNGVREIDRGGKILWQAFQGGGRRASGVRRY